MVIYKPSSSINPTSSKIFEIFHSVIGNRVRTYNIKDTYLYKDDLWPGILEVAEFKVFSTENSLTVYIPGE